MPFPRPHRFHVVSGQSTRRCRAWEEIADWCRAAAVARACAMPHRLPGPHLPRHAGHVLRLHRRHAQLGAHIEVLEMDDWQRAWMPWRDAEFDAKLVDRPRDRSTWTRRARERSRVGSPRGRRARSPGCRFRARRFHLLLSRARGNEFERLGAALILGNTLLTARGIPAAAKAI